MLKKLKPTKIYTVGKMHGVPLSEQRMWRIKIENAIKRELDRRSIDWSNISFINPPDFYNYEENNHKSEREVKEWELSQVMDSDILIANLKGINDSVGSHFEIATAGAVNALGQKHIFIMGIGKLEGFVHPWIIDSFIRIEEDYLAAVNYIVDYLLV